MKTKLISLIENWFPIYRYLAIAVAFVLSLAIGFVIGTGGTWLWFYYH